MGKRLPWIILPLAAVLICCAYAQLTDSGFVSFDDYEYVTENGHIRNGFTYEAVRWAFTSLYASNWHPLTWLSHLLDVELYGLKAAGHHLTNLLFHTLNFLLLATFLWRMTGAFGRSLTVALLFALHPLHVESVAWVAERKDLLCAFFWFLALHAYTSYAKRPGTARYLLVLLSFSLGLMAKPMMVTLPLVLFLLDFWPLERFRSRTASPSDNSAIGVPLGRLVAEKVPLLLLAGAAGLITVMAQQAGGSLNTLKGSLLVNAGNALVGYGDYLAKMCWPAGLTFFYPLPPGSPTTGRLAASGLLLLSVTWLAVGKAKSRRYLLTGWLWYLITLLPVIGLVKVGSQAVADRYTYLPLTGIFIMVVWGAWDLTRNCRWRERLVQTAAVAVIILYATLTWRQTGYWRNNQTLYDHALAVTNDNWMAYNNLGKVLFEEGKLVEAATHYARAVAINPDFFEANYNYGVVLLKLGREQEALGRFSVAVLLKPLDLPARQSMGTTLARTGRLDEALAQFREIIRIAPNEAQAHYNLGVALSLQGKHQEAIAAYTEALRIRPDFTMARQNRENSLMVGEKPP